MNGKHELIQYRRLKASDTLKDAHILFESDGLSSAVNRIYYAIFYEVSALLLTKDLSSSKHSGIRALFNENFIKTKTVSQESGRFYSAMSDFRQKGDYSDFVNFEKEKVSDWLEQAKKFIDEIELLFEQ